MPNLAAGQSQSNSKLGEKKETRREGVLLNQCKSSVNYAAYFTRWLPRVYLQIEQVFVVRTVGLTTLFPE